MKKSKYTDGQIAFAVKQAETDPRAEEVCRKMGISQAALYSWKKKCGGLSVNEVRRIKSARGREQILCRSGSPA